MADLIFHYRPSGGPVNRYPSFYKVIILFLFCIAVALAPAFLLPLPALYLLLLNRWEQVTLKAQLAALRPFRVLFLLIFAVHALSLQTGAPFLRLVPSGITAGLFYLLRFSIILLAAALFIRTTPVDAVRDTVSRLLAPLPLIPAAVVGTLAGLTLGLLPVINETLASTRRAAMARGGTAIKNPFRRLRLLTLPSLLQLLRHSDEMSRSMDARGFRPDRLVMEEQEGDSLRGSFILHTAVLILFAAAGVIL